MVPISVSITMVLSKPWRLPAWEKWGVKAEPDKPTLHPHLGSLKDGKKAWEAACEMVYNKLCSCGSFSPRCWTGPLQLLGAPGGLHTGLKHLPQGGGFPLWLSEALLSISFVPLAQGTNRGWWTSWGGVTIHSWRLTGLSYIFSAGWWVCHMGQNQRPSWGWDVLPLLLFCYLQHALLCQQRLWDWSLVICSFNSG